MKEVNQGPEMPASTQDVDQITGSGRQDIAKVRKPLTTAIHSLLDDVMNRVWIARFRGLSQLSSLIPQTLDTIRNAAAATIGGRTRP